MSTSSSLHRLWIKSRVYNPPHTCLSIMATWRLNTFWKLNAITNVPLDFKKPSLAWRKHVIIPHWRGAPMIKWTCYFPGRWTIIKRNLSVQICNHQAQERWHERSWHSGSGNGTKPTATGGASRAAWKATREATVVAPAPLPILSGGYY